MVEVQLPKDQTPPRQIEVGSRYVDKKTREIFVFDGEHWVSTQTFEPPAVKDDPGKRWDLLTELKRNLSTLELNVHHLTVPQLRESVRTTRSMLQSCMEQRRKNAD